MLSWCIKLALIYKLHHVGRTGFDLEKGAQVTTVKKHLILKYMGHSRWKAISNDKHLELYIDCYLIWKNKDFNLATILFVAFFLEARFPKCWIDGGSILALQELYL